ncbi:hypothetical protein K435DRAFT_808181 [Dendrothele bispora CBS 962.96]|uniref:Uncharacterized protein n=1 Tax=Dendrothele bispora (strain CBS 962.96) TaxID=1314807 RepID=A0A4S8L3J3_DENBC|nr:hypothetical protein K435DRAFT_808181 [Dendrothele bispora CBS 962.96]
MAFNRKLLVTWNQANTARFHLFKVKPKLRWSFAQCQNSFAHKGNPECLRCILFTKLLSAEYKNWAQRRIERKPLHLRIKRHKKVIQLWSSKKTYGVAKSDPSDHDFGQIIALMERLHLILSIVISIDRIKKQTSNFVRYQITKPIFYTTFLAIIIKSPIPPPTEPVESTISDVSSISGPNHTPVIAGSVIAGALAILAIVLLFWRYKKKAALRSILTSGKLNNGQAPKEAIYQIEPYDLKHISIRNPGSMSSQSIVGNNEVAPSASNLARNSVDSTIATTSTLTERQIRLRDETETLREQMKILQQAVLSSNVELQREIAIMGSHILRLESWWNSDWARGLSDDPPPGYES